MTFTKVTEYIAETVTIRFVPISNVPGFTHKVLIIRNDDRKVIKKDWLGSDFKVSEKAAKYFYEKHIAAIAA